MSFSIAQTKHILCLFGHHAALLQPNCQKVIYLRVNCSQAVGVLTTAVDYSGKKTTTSNRPSSMRSFILPGAALGSQLQSSTRAFRYEATRG